MRILIIGGTGLISSSIVRRLIARGDSLTVLNRGEATRPLPDGVARIRCDRRDFDAFDRAIRETAPWDVVIDMVCFLPDEAESVARALPGRTAQYLMTSTIDVYEKPAASYPYTEAAGYGGLGDYAVAKVACERILWAAHERGDLPLTVIRPGATYGDGHAPVHILRSATYADRLLRGKPIVVHGDGSSFWPSCHADDMARAFDGAAGNQRTIGKAYHATGEEWLTWDQHHAAVARAIGAPPPTLVHIPTDVLTALVPERTSWVRNNFQFNNIFDNSAAHAELGFEYKIPLHDGAARWFSSLQAAGAIQDSDEDPFEDRLIELWQRHVADAAREAQSIGLDD